MKTTVWAIPKGYTDIEGKVEFSEDDINGIKEQIASDVTRAGMHLGSVEVYYEFIEDEE